MSEKKERSLASVLATTACIVGVAAGGVCGYLLFSGTESFQRQFAANEAQIGQLQLELDTMKAQQSQSVEDARTDLSTAATAGNAVAELQNKYAHLSDADANSLTDNALALDSHFGSQDKDARTPWYSGKDYAWTFETTYSFRGDSVPVIWSCHNTAGELVAYTMATYSKDTKLFTNVSTYFTAVSAGSVEDETEGSPWAPPSEEGPVGPNYAETPVAIPETEPVVPDTVPDVPVPTESVTEPETTREDIPGLVVPIESEGESVSVNDSMPPETSMEGGVANE